jgi:hypothetical protein
MKKFGNDLGIVGEGKPACRHASAHPIQERHNSRCNGEKTGRQFPQESRRAMRPNRDL